MAEYDNTNRGALFKNKDKETDKRPDYQGNINVGGVEYWLSAWLKTSKAGAKYMSLSVTPKDPPKAETTPEAGTGFEDDDIPF